MKGEIPARGDGQRTKKLFAFCPSAPGADQIPVYVLADGEDVWAFGRVPAAAAEAFGRNAPPPGSYDECVMAVWRRASAIYFPESGVHTGYREMFDVGPRALPCGVERFSDKETAEIISAAAGWPAPVRLFPQEDGTI